MHTIRSGRGVIRALALLIVVPTFANAQATPSANLDACLSVEVVDRAREIGAYLEDMAICEDDMQCIWERGEARPGDLVDCAMLELERCSGRTDGLACLADLTVALESRARGVAEVLDADAYLEAAAALPTPERQTMIGALYGLFQPVPFDCALIAPLELEYGIATVDASCAFMWAWNWHAGLLDVQAHAQRAGIPLPTLSPQQVRARAAHGQPDGAAAVSLLPPRKGND